MAEFMNFIESKLRGALNRLKHPVVDTDRSVPTAHNPQFIPKDLDPELPDDLRNALGIAGNTPGWMKPAAAHLTFGIFPALPIGPAMEIGVYRGKYLSIVRAALGPDQQLVGYDLFPERGQEADILKTLSTAYGSVEHTRLIREDSTNLTVERVIEDCGGRPVFISIDGAHDADPVFSDICVAANAMHDDGIISLDDYINPFALGVNEAFLRYVYDPEKRVELQPFAYVSNKLFICRPACVDGYRQAAIAAFDKGASAKWLTSYRERKNANSPNTIMYCGAEMLVVP